jgi:tRNA1(Val) A37 N6-methylase TrmN6
MAATARLLCNKKISIHHKESKPTERLLLEFSYHSSICHEGKLVLFNQDEKRTPSYHQLVSEFYLTE